MNSIVQDGEPRCFICGSMRELELHHIMAGTANRRLSTRYGLVCWLCRTHHTGRFGVHHDHYMMEMLKCEAQKAFENTHTRAEWMQIFGKNYL